MKKNTKYLTFFLILFLGCSSTLDKNPQSHEDENVNKENYSIHERSDLIYSSNKLENEIFAVLQKRGVYFYDRSGTR